MTWEQAVDWLKSQPQHTALTKACFYDDPLIEAAQRYSVSTEWQAVRHLLKGLSGKALDIGAGRGISSYALAKDGWSVTALEPDPSASVGAGAVRQLAVEADISINVVQEWGEKLPFASGEFDLVYCRAVLHHADDLNALCIEAARVLREGGMMIATREHVLTNHGELQRFLRAHPLHDLYGGEHAYLLPEYTGALEQAGFEIKQILNPYASDINLFPMTQAELKQKWARKWRLPISTLIPQSALIYFGERNRLPGRLYSFVAQKS